MSNGLLTRCYFCGASLLHECRCFRDVHGNFGPVLFKTPGCDINCPNLDVSGRFFVDPVEYYGEQYINWEFHHRLENLLEEP